MLILALLIFFLQFPCGSLMMSFIDGENRLTRWENALATIVIGPTVCCFLLLLILLISGSWDAAIFSMWAILTVTLLVSINRFPAKKLNAIGIPKFDLRYLNSFNTWILLALFLLYAGILFGGFLLNEQGYPSVISLGWADTSYHLSIVGRLSTAEPFILENPIASGIDLNYTFMINLLTAFYQRIGFPLFSAWHLSNAIYGVSFFFLLYLFGKRLLNSGLLSTSLVAVVFFGGGLGFVLYFPDLGAAFSKGGIEQLIHTIINPPHEYTYLHTRYGGDPEEFGKMNNIHWIVPAISFLSHQRAFLPGLAMAIILFIGIISYKRSRHIWKWGIILGMIPLFHTHSFISSCIVLACWFIFDFRNYRAWIIGGFICAIIAIPQILYITPSGFSDEFSFLRPWFGWMMCTHNNNWLNCDKGISGVDSNILWFWTKNFGMVFWGWVAYLLLYLLHKKGLYTKRIFSLYLTLPCICLFLIPNLVLFQTWEFDNNKILYFWWIFAAVCTIKLAKYVFNNRKSAIITFIVVILLSTFSGMIDIVSRVSKIGQNHYGYYDSNDVEAAEWISNNTIPNARFLTGDFVDQYVPMLTGRAIYLGYPGWLWYRGIKSLINERRTNATDFLTTGNADVMCKEGINYVLWDRRLLSTYPGADKNKLLTSSRIVYSNNGIEILEISCSN